MSERAKYRSVHFMGVEVHAVYDKDLADLFHTMWNHGKKLFTEDNRESMAHWLKESGALTFYPSVHWLWDGVFWDNGDGYWEKIGEREDKTELSKRQAGYVR